ncbi:MAG: transglycosylase SLT domain-containing protein [Deltaproteobacteria bacterium]
MASLAHRRSHALLPLLCLSLLLTLAQPARAEEPALDFPAEFSIPTGMEGRVAFWVEVFAKTPLADAIVHDRENPERVLAIVRMKKGNRKERQAIERRYRKLLEAIAAAPPERHEAILQAFDGPLDRRWLGMKPADLRIHRGQSEVFANGLARARFYSRGVKKELRSRGLPALLAHLPYIESSYNPKARSRAGALGLWQLMPRTARQYIQVNRRRDERRDPQRSTYAAARYLNATHRALGNWPLALTAYNYGPSALQRAINQHQTTDLAEIIKHHKDRRFGFAGKNFYAQFLAAAHVAENASYYFPDVDTSEMVTHTVQRGDTLWDIARHYGVSLSALKRANTRELSRSRYLKPGIRLVVEG